MGRSNGNKAAMKRERNAKKVQADKGETSQLKSNQKAMNLQCAFCRQSFLSTADKTTLDAHVEKHSKAGKSFADCFPGVEM
jgi:hypothetical protein